MSFVGRFLDGIIVFVFLLLFAGVMWPPDGYFAGPTLTSQGQSNIYDFLEFACLLPFLALGFLAYRGELLRLVTYAWPVLVLSLFAFLSAFWSDDPSLVIRRSVTVTASTLFGVYLVVRGDFDALVVTLVKVYALAAI